MSDRIDDPVWPVLVKERLQPYIPYVRDWWAKVDDLDPFDTGVYPIEHEDAPGLFYRFTRTAVRSPIRGIQAFPFVVSAYLQITGVRGGSTKLIQRICMDRQLTLEEFTLVELHNLPSTFNQGQLIAFVPSETLERTHECGKWLYMTPDEISGLIQGVIYPSLKNKAILKG